MDNQKMIFANTINELGSFGVLGAGDCHNFGSTWGCRIECPQFDRGGCKDVFYGNIIQFIKDGDIYDDSEFLDTLIKYENKLSQEEINNLFLQWEELK